MLTHKETHSGWNKQFDTYIIAFCPDIDLWSVTSQRCFYYEYEKEFNTEAEAVQYFYENLDIFGRIEVELMKDMGCKHLCRLALEDNSGNLLGIFSKSKQ